MGDDQVEDAVRVCPSHRVVLEERRGDVLFCRAGRHRVKRWLVVARRNSRALYEVSAEQGATRMADADEKVQIKDHEPKSQTLDRAKFEDGSKAVLFIRLTREPKRYGGDPFRIRWQQRTAQGVKKGVVGGVAKTCPDESSARDAFKAAVRSATSQGWGQVPVGQGGPRTLVLKPIPAPKKPARRGR